MNLPKDYQSKMQEMLGEEYLQYLDSFNHSYGQTRSEEHTSELQSLRKSRMPSSA